MVRRFYCFYGRVQGVGFRFTASAIAESLGLTGWGGNPFDHVELEVQGPADLSAELIRGLNGESAWIRIERTTVEERPLKREKKFRITW